MALNVGCIIIFFSSSGLALWRVPAGDVVAGQLPGRGSFREDGPKRLLLRKEKNGKDLIADQEKYHALSNLQFTNDENQPRRN